MTRLAIITAALAAASGALGAVIPLDPNSEQPLHEQIVQAVRSSPTTAPTTAQTVMAEVDAQLAAIDREVARLRALGQPGKHRADRLEERLGELRERRKGRGVLASDQPELHVVAVHASPALANKHLPPRQRRRQFKAGRATVNVEVQSTGRPIVLVVCSYGPTQWELSVARDATVKRVIVGGYENQLISGVPEGAALEIHTHEGPNKSPNSFYTMGPGNDGHDAAVAKLKALTGMEISTLQLNKRYTGGSIIVGPGSDEWVAQRMLLDLRPVYHEAVAYSLARQRQTVQNVRFKAVWVAPPPPQPGQPPRPAVPAGGGVRIMVGPQRGFTISLAEFTPAGPIEGTESPLPQGTNHVAVDPNDSTVYAIDNHQVYRIDAKTRRPTRLEMDNHDLPRISWCSGLTFDTKRRRLVLSTSNTLYAYDPATQKWTGIVDLENLRPTSFTYSAAHDCFYAVLSDSVGRGGSLRLLRYSAEGDADQVIELPPQPQPVTTIPFRPDGFPQLIAVGQQLAFIPPSPLRSPFVRPADAGQPAPPMKCLLIDPVTGDVTYSGALKRQAGEIVKLTNNELASAWRALTSQDAAEVEPAIAKLAAAGDQAVDHIRANFEPPPATDPAQVRAWIAQLDLDDFATRDAATDELRRVGRDAEPLLREALANNASPETVTRISGLLAELDAPPVAAVSRHERATQLLARIGTPNAIEALSEWAAGPSDSPLTKAARRALQDFARE